MIWGSRKFTLAEGKRAGVWRVFATLCLAFVMATPAAAQDFKAKRGVVLKGFEAGEHNNVLTEAQSEQFLKTSGLDGAGTFGAGGDWMVSWYYTYGMFPGATADWAGRNGVEFVPMIWGQALKMSDGTKCRLLAASKSVPKCTVGQFDDQLAETIRIMNEAGAPPIRYIMAVNEAYSESQANLSAPETVRIYADYIMPIAVDKYGLEIVGPAVSTSKRGRTSLAWFLRRCRESAKCDPEKISRFNLHHYYCRENKWTRLFSSEDVAGTDNNRDDLWYDRMVKELGKVDAEHAEMWEGYIRSRKIWITETTCNQDFRPVGIGTPQQACERMTGTTSEPGWGKGSLGTINDLDRIERYAWWTAYLDRSDTQALMARLMELDGSRSLVGRGYSNYRPDAVDANICR